MQFVDLQVVDLLPNTEEMLKLLAVCRQCGADAPFSHRKVADIDVQLIGGDDKYMALCRSCYTQHNAK